MESVIFEDSPLASYLEGLEGREASLSSLTLTSTQGSGKATSDTSNHQSDTPGETEIPPTFAPTGPSTASQRYKRRLPPSFRVHTRNASQSLNRLHESCSSAVNSQLGRRENALFLERFRYIIIASQLLSDRSNAAPYSRPAVASVSSARASSEEPPNPTLTTIGLLGSGGAAFILVASMAWARTIVEKESGFLQVLLMLAVLSVAVTILWRFIRKAWLQRVRAQAVDGVSELTTSAQTFDAAISAAISVIQEVELVARGYRISSPLPPVSRLDDQGPVRRCARLRTTLHGSMGQLLLPLARAVKSTKSRVVETDLERYYDIYEITRADLDEIDTILTEGSKVSDDPMSLQALKSAAQRLHLIRRVLLCNFLALNTDGGRADFSVWATVSTVLEGLAVKYSQAAASLDDVLSEGEQAPVSPSTPKVPITPGRERVRTQIRKLGGLSSGIRGLQARMHMLREEADQGLECFDEDTSELGANLLSQYDAIGSDLRLLLREWEEGRAALSASLDAQNKRRSTSSMGTNGLLSPRSATPTSLGGLTAVEEGPGDAFKALDGEPMSPRSAFDGASGSDDEVFEAIALPRTRERSSLSREERIAKMRDERAVKDMAGDRAKESTNMLRELETVLKHKLSPATKASRRVTVM